MHPRDAYLQASLLLLQMRTLTSIWAKQENPFALMAMPHAYKRLCIHLKPLACSQSAQNDPECCGPSPAARRFSETVQSWACFLLVALSAA